MTSVETILLAPTPAAWVDHAVANWRELLVDHANCEKKAASTALALMFAYPQDRKTASSARRCRAWRVKSCATSSKCKG